VARPLLSLAVLALLALAACSAETNPYSSKPYALSELSLEITADAARYPGSGIDVRVRLLADYNGQRADLRLDDEDLLLVALDGRETALTYGVPDYHGYLADRGESLNVRFVSPRGHAVVPVPLARPFTVVASPSTFAIGDRITIDLSPRPVLSKETTVEITPEGCAGSVERIFATELPFVWDTSKLIRNKLDADAGAPPPRCPVRLTTVVETIGARPVAIGSSPLGPGTKARTSRAVRSEIEVRP
jgi:hypothetical protein